MTAPARSPEAQSAQTVTAAMRVLDVLEAAESPLPVAAIARGIGRSRGTTYRLLGSLREAGMVARDASGGYLLGPRLLQLARRTTQQSSLVAVATPVIAELRNRFVETVFLSVVYEMQILTVAEAVSPHPLRFSRGIGAADPIHTGATGRALLSTLGEDERARVFERLDMRRYTPITLTSIDALAAAVRQVDELGYAVSFGEYIEGVVALACPIHGQRAAITILGPSDRFGEEVALAAVPALHEAAAAVAARV